MLDQTTFNFSMPTNIVFGSNSVKENLIDTIKNYNKQKAFIATDPGLVKAGIPYTISTLLNENGIDSFVFSEVEPNPLADTVMRGVDEYHQEGCDMIIALGGGSAMDFAKSVGVVASNQGHILDFRRGQKPVDKEIPFLVAIPTTVGTGSEVTAVAVITDKNVERKYVIASPKIMPDYAFIDPSLTVSLPRQVVAATGIDALVHALEAYVSLKATPITDGLAVQAIKMLKEHLPASYAQPSNAEARAQIHLASTIAGIAFGFGGLGIVHSCSHPMSAVYNVPHGLANAILLPYVVEHNLIANYKKYADIARIFDSDLYHLNDEKAARKLPSLLRNFTSLLDIPENFNYLSIQFNEEMVERLATDAMDDVGTVPNNPRKAYKEDIIRIYNNALPLHQKEESLTDIY